MSGDEAKYNGFGLDRIADSKRVDLSPKERNEQS